MRREPASEGRRVLHAWLPLAVAVVVLLGSALRALAVECDDGNLCTVNDMCRNGHCVGEAVNCGSGGDACMEGVCNPSTGECETRAIDCDDGNPCTTDSCDSATGCIHTSVSNGMTCDDGNDCTADTTCQDGKCVAAAIFINGTHCGGNDPCFFECQDGVCVHDVHDGEKCDDMLDCTDNDTCSSGDCVGQTDCGSNLCLNAKCSGPPPGSCSAIDKCPAVVTTCFRAGDCDGDTGECLITPLNEGQTCDDSNSCTAGDRCVAGACEGTALGPGMEAPALSPYWLAAVAAALGAFALYRVRSRHARS
jgi:Dictyostelium (slime mold) repeat